MCKYCRERGSREDILEDEKLIIKIKKEKVLGFALRVESENHAFATNINYCPMCGRKLGDSNE